MAREGEIREAVESCRIGLRSEILDLEDRFYVLCDYLGVSIAKGSRFRVIEKNIKPPAEVDAPRGIASPPSHRPNAAAEGKADEQS